MAKVEIYTWRTCPFCIRAKHLLDSKQVSYTEYAIDGDNAARDAMAERSGGHRSVPEIFIDDRHIGGCDELHALERAGELDPLLAA
ncbi:glutaredoxin 3 [Synechococcus sp. A15-127]|jgi:glutaredoxin 3|uniref:glutaredoxin 3 n=1 Tax=Synechococcus sp. A15-127 TaxID=1050624 RepID=UPI0016490384|nr:glutaredoxin 3 [Synechococcus sp. A15-127]QNI95707.1 glutaredoxin 3 [Synechococcus sp. A15-127]